MSREENQMNGRTVRLKDGGEMPALGQGTWRMGGHKGREEQEIGSIRLGISLGMTLLDTAEMYGEGAAERCLLYTSPSPRDRQKSRMPSSA